MSDLSRKIDVELPTMTEESAENMVLGGQLAMTLLNFLELNPEILYKMYPNKEKFATAEDDFGLNQDEIKDQFMSANRKALMIVSYVFKYIANQVIDEYDVDRKHFSFNVENKLMMKDLEEDKAETEVEELNESEVFEELHRILGGLS